MCHPGRYRKPSAREPLVSSPDARGSRYGDPGCRIVPHTDVLLWAFTPPPLPRPCRETSCRRTYDGGGGQSIARWRAWRNGSSSAGAGVARTVRMPLRANLRRSQVASSELAAVSTCRARPRHTGPSRPIRWVPRPAVSHGPAPGRPNAPARGGHRRPRSTSSPDRRASTAGESQ